MIATLAVTFPVPGLTAGNDAPPALAQLPGALEPIRAAERELESEPEGDDRGESRKRGERPEQGSDRGASDDRRASRGDGDSGDANDDGDGSTDDPGDLTGTGLKDWPDPRSLEGWHDYPEEPVKEGGLSQPLGDVADDMARGEWRRLPDAPYLAHGKWTDKASWDAARQRVAYVAHHTPGGERPTRWVMWDVANNEWHRQTGNQFHPYAGIDNRWGYRSYGKYTQLPDGSNVYTRFKRLWRQDPETLEWSVWAHNPCYEIISNIEYFPEMGAVIAFGATYPGSDETQLCAYHVDTGEWERLARPDVQGRHSLMRYNPVHGEMLLVGGDQSYRRVQALDAEGRLSDVADTPRNTRIMKDMLAVDPISGDYLLMVYTKDPERGVSSSTVEFFGLNREADDWYRIAIWTREANHVDGLEPPAWPFTSKHAEPVVAILPDHDVTLWLESTRPGVWLYKHEAPQR